MSDRKREAGPSLEGIGKVSVELERLRQRVVQGKSKRDAAIVNRMFARTMNNSSYRPPPSGEVDFDEAFREVRELLEKLNNMSPDEFDAVMAMEARAE